MKKLLAGVVALMLLFVSINALGVDEVKTVMNSEAKSINIKYSNYTDELISIIVYDITDVLGANVGTNFIDTIETPIVGLETNIATGKFEFPVAKDLNGKFIVQISGAFSGPTRILLEIVDGIPSPIEVSYDAKNLEYVLSDGEQVKIEANGILQNAVIDATKGSVLYGDTVLTGRIQFSGQGEINAAGNGTIIKLKSPSNEKYGYYNQGFIKKVELSEVQSPYVVTLAASNGYTYDTEFDLGDGMFTGTVRLLIGVKNIPDGIEVVCK